MQRLKAHLYLDKELMSKEDYIEFKGKVTAVDIDPEIISLANKYFKLNEIPNLTIYIEDANQFVQNTNRLTYHCAKF